MLSIESGVLVQVLIGFGVILILIFLLTWIMKKLNLVSARIARQGEDPRLSIKEVIAVDHKRRLLLVRRDNVEHLLMIGGEADLVVEQGIPAPMSLPHVAAAHGKAATIAQPPIAAAPAAQPHHPAQMPAAAVPQPAQQDLPQPPIQPRMAPPRPLSGQPYSPATAHPSGQAPIQSPAAPQMAPSYGNQPTSSAARPHDAPPPYAPAASYTRPTPPHSAMPPKGPKLHQPQRSEAYGRDPQASPTSQPADSRQAPRYGRPAAPMTPQPVEQAPTQSEEAGTGRIRPQVAPEASSQPRPASEPSAANTADQPAPSRREPQTPALKDAPSPDTVPSEHPSPVAKHTGPAQPTSGADMDESKPSAPGSDEVKAPETEKPSAESSSKETASEQKPVADQQADQDPIPSEAANRPHPARSERPAHGLRPLAESASYDDEINRLLNELSSEIKK
nr:flagellar biosynthetic protein FliO [uncultured Cohaesibacter sp.]